jgi:TATA-box binding protein (TBP) (component of TFIID and TFIIIB)
MQNPIFTPLRISTLVTTGHVGNKVNIQALFDAIQDYIIPLGYPDEGVLKMEHEKYVKGWAERDVLTKRKVSDRIFFNQATLVIRKRRLGEAEAYKEVNVKLFANGGFQMTGITSESFSRAVVDWLLDMLTRILGEEFTLAKFAIQLLNSDYKVNADVKRSELHKILCQDYRMFSTLETTNYQGVKTGYYYNESYPIKTGICHCPDFCNGQGDGTVEGACKKITIAVFQTGSIIVTGARNIRQLDEAYDFMNRVLQRHAPDVLGTLRAPAVAAVAAVAAVPALA